MHSVLINAICNGCRGNRVSVLIDYSAKCYFLTGQREKCCILREYTEKSYQIQNVHHTVSGKFCSPLFTHLYTANQQAPPGWKFYDLSKNSLLNEKGVHILLILYKFQLFATEYIIYLDSPLLQIERKKKMVSEFLLWRTSCRSSPVGNVYPYTRSISHVKFIDNVYEPFI